MATTAAASRNLLPDDIPKKAVSLHVWLHTNGLTQAIQLLLP